MKRLDAVTSAPGVAVSAPTQVHPARATEASAVAERSVTLRVVVLALVLAALLGYLCPVIDYKLFNTFLDASHLPPGAVGVLLVMVGIVNPLLKYVSRRWAFSRNELLTTYTCCLFSSLVPGHGSENFLVPNLITPFYYATRENRWLDWLRPNLEPWLTPALNADRSVNTAVVSGWYDGLREGQTIPWGAWLVPLAVWMSVVLISYAMMACLSVILRRQWAENEALAFPLLKLPLHMTEREERAPNERTFWHDPKMWVGFGIAVAYQSVRALHLYYPNFPDLAQGLDLGPYFSEPPWNQLGWTPLEIYLIVIGITYLLTDEVAFSLWFFFWFVKFQLFGAYLIGYMPNTLPDAVNLTPGKAFIGYQVSGAYIGYIGLVMWTGREHFRHVARRALGRERARPSESTELLSYPAAFWGFVGCFGLMVGFAWLTGVRLDVALALWGTYLLVAVGLARVAIEGGMLLLAHDSAPLGVFARLLPGGGNGWLTLQNGLMPASVMQAGFVVHLRGFILPSFIQSFKLAHDRKIEPRPLRRLLIAVILVSVVVSWTTVVRLGYENNGLSLGHQWYAHWGSLWPVNFVDSMNQPAQTAPS